MGLGGISIWQLLIILLIIVLLFGSGKLRSLGGDLGSAVKDFRKGVKDGDREAGSEADGQERSGGDGDSAPKDKDAG